MRARTAGLGFGFEFGLGFEFGFGFGSGCLQGGHLLEGVHLGLILECDGRPLPLL